MASEIPASLPEAPASVENGRGHPRFGTYRGSLHEVDLSRLDPPYQLGVAERLLKHKRWVYTFVATPEVLAAAAITHLSYTANAFALVADLRDRRVLVDQSYLGLPGPLTSVGNRPAEGLTARFRAPGARFHLARAPQSERYVQQVELSRLLPIPHHLLHWDGELLAAGGAPPLSVIAPVADDGVVNVTQKWAAMLAFGTLEAGGRRFVLDGGVGGLDYSQGYLARHTSWRWAFACGRLPDGTPLGLNLVEGFNEGEGANENAVWLGGQLYPVDRARFTFNRRDVLDEWRVETVDGAVRLTFRPFGAHREERDLRVVRSRFAQPVGFFQGTVVVEGRRVEVVELAGVTEDQDILW